MSFLIFFSKVLCSIWQTERRQTHIIARTLFFIQFVSRLSDMFLNIFGVICNDLGLDFLYPDEKFHCDPCSSGISGETLPLRSFVRIRSKKTDYLDFLSD